MGHLHYKGYTGSVHRDGIIFEGDSADSLKKDFEESIEDYLAHCKEKGKEPEKPFSGKTVLRMSSELHQQAAAKARSIGISLNEFINRAISAAVL